MSNEERKLQWRESQRRYNQKHPNMSAWRSYNRRRKNKGLPAHTMDEYLKNRKNTARKNSKNFNIDDIDPETLERIRQALRDQYETSIIAESEELTVTTIMRIKDLMIVAGEL